MGLKKPALNGTASPKTIRPFTTSTTAQGHQCFLLRPKLLSLRKASGKSKLSVVALSGTECWPRGTKP